MSHSTARFLGLAVALSAAATAIAGPPKPTAAVQAPLPRPSAQAVPIYTDLAMARIYTDTQTCRLWVTWENKGTRSIDATLKERVSVHTQPYRTDEGMNHVVLAPGQSFSHAVGAGPGFVISGATEVLAHIDVDNVLGESVTRRENNAIYRTVTCGRAQPDLYPSTVEFTVKTSTTDAQGHACKLLQAKPVILNIGTAPVRTSFQVKVETDSGAGRAWVSRHTTTVSSMTVGQRRVLDGFQIDTCLWFVHNPNMQPNSPRRFRLTVDSGGAVRESQEDNNEGTVIY